ncbi:MAG: hypothetical protein KBT36_08045 [Kurthia sp.]|nr:hypothetical protein [Candidatus Kurthia equi]
MAIFAHKTWGGMKISFYKIEVKNQEIWFRKIGNSLLYDFIEEMNYSLTFFSDLIYKYISKPMYRKRMKKVNKAQGKKAFLKQRGNFIIPFDEIERIHYNTPIKLDIYFILQDGKKYNFAGRFDDKDTIEELFKGIEVTAKDHLW